MMIAKTTNDDENDEDEDENDVEVDDIMLRLYPTFQLPVAPPNLLKRFPQLCHLARFARHSATNKPSNQINLDTNL